MLLSMTGYGEARYRSDTLNVSIELRAVNNRYLKVSLRATDPYHLLESEFEKRIRQTVRRGTLQVHLRWENLGPSTLHRINTTALKSYLAQLRDVAAELKLSDQGALLSQALTLPGVVEEPQNATGGLHDDWKIIEPILTQALDKMQEMRKEEGQAMYQEMVQYQEEINSRLNRIRDRLPNISSAYRERLFERIQSVLTELDVVLDKNDLIREVAVYSERSDIAEEVTRLASHLDQFQDIMNEPESPGRKLEFLTQEMFREVNTIGSKASDVEISRHVVEIKGVLEKIRELVLNVE